MSVILSIGTAVPSYSHSQQAIETFMLEHLGLSRPEQRMLRAVYRQSAVDTRHSVIPDYSQSTHPEAFYPQTEDLEPFPTVKARQRIFDDNALALAMHSTQSALDKISERVAGVQQRITHVISISCTGLSAPGLDIDLVQALDLPMDTYRTSVNFMGCYAAFHALKLADAICRSEPTALVLLAGVELCTLHFQKSPEIDHIIANSLFADGAASVLVTSKAQAEAWELPGLSALHYGSMLAPQGRKDMAWGIGVHGFEMTLSTYVPDLVEEGIGPLLHGLFAKLGLSIDTVKHWAIHPGGKRILQATEKALQLSEQALANSFHVLRHFGNMSSVTVLFVLERLMAQLDYAAEETVFSAGFGPGLTMEAAVFKAVPNVPAAVAELLRTEAVAAN